ncbi:hypothetical protein ACQ4PT_064967 [Festuca glaucescens]
MAGDHSCFFSIEINHGGYFLGTGSNRSYASGSVIWYDDLDMVSWSSALLENIIEEIGYEMCGRIKVHYCIPFLTLARNGLRQLRDADDSDRMLAFVDIGHHFISLYLDHDDSLTTRQWDDVVYYLVTTLPAVISPAKPSSHTEPESYVDAAAEEDVHAAEEEDLHVPLQVVLPDNVPADQCIGARTRQRKRARSQTVPEDEADDVKEIDDEDDHDSDYDPEDIVDSDYDMNSEEVKEKAAPTFEGKGKACKEENSEEEDLWGPESDDDTAPLRFKTFREVDLADPHFHVGQTFESVELLRKAIQAYSCKYRKDIKLPVNDLKRLNGRCTEECSCTEVLGELQGRPGYEYEEFLKDSAERVVYDSREIYILEARELPVLSMFERIKGQIMTRNYNKQKEEEKWPGVVCPKIKKRVLKNVELSNNCYADGAGDGLFAVYDMVSSTPVDYIVDLKTKTCTCSRWQKSGIPCPHVASVARKDGIDPLSLVDNCYSIEMHKRAYGNIVYPCKDKSEWEKMGGPTILPPSYKKHVGRPTKNRRKAPGEVDCRGGGKRMSRHGVIMHCSHCGRPDHNRNGCYWFKNGLPAPDQPQGNNPEPEEGTGTTTGQAPQPELGTDSTPAYENTFVDNLTQERPFVRNMDPSPTPTSTFITAAQATLNQVQASSSTIKQGELAQKLKAMHNEKDKAVEERKLAILEAKYQAEVKKAEAVAKKRFELEKKKAEQAEARASIAAAKKEKRKYDAEINKLAKTETRRIIAEVKKSCADKKKLEAAELKKIQAAEKKRLAAQEKAAMRAASTEAQSSHNAKKVSMFDELRAPARK